MFCSYCAYGQLPMDAPCCYICGHSPPYSSQPLYIAKKGISKLPGECPNCRSQYTASGRANIKEDISICIWGTLLTLGIGLIVFIPYVLVHIATKHYTPNRFRIISEKWGSRGWEGQSREGKGWFSPVRCEEGKSRWCEDRVAKMS